MDDPQWPRASAWLESGGTDAEEAPLLAVIGAPLSVGSISPSRADTTPPAVRAALRRYSTLAALQGNQTVDLAGVRVADLGDLDLDGLANADAQDLIAAAVAEIQDSPALDRAPDLLVVLGGDNAITRPVMAACVDNLPRAGLLTLDAHHDVRDFSNGLTNGTPVRGLIDDGLPGTSVVQVGIGMFTNSPQYRRFCDDAGITLVMANDARAEGVGACVQRHLDVLAEHCEQIYVDLDVDVLDSAFAPGCPGARPGGFSPHELVAAAFAAGRHPSVIALDIVEVDAEADTGGTTVDVGAQCLLAAAAGLAAR